MASALQILVVVYRAQGEYADAVSCLIKAQRVYLNQEIVPMEKLGQALLMLGDTYARWGKPERSLIFYKEALVVLENHADASPVLLGLAFKGLGDLFRNKSNLQIASIYYSGCYSVRKSIDCWQAPICGHCKLPDRSLPSNG